MIDLVEIRKLVKDGIFTTYLSRGVIYLKNNKTSETVAIGTYVEQEEKYYADGKMIISKITIIPNEKLEEVNT